MLRSKSFTLTSDGAGDASATVGMPTCEVLGFQVDDVDGVTDGATLTLASAGRNIFSKANMGTDQVVQLAHDTVDAAGAAMADWSMHPIVHASIVATGAGMGAAKSLKVTLFYR